MKRTCIALFSWLLLLQQSNAQTTPCKDISLPYRFAYDNITGGGGYGDYLTTNVKAQEMSLTNGTVSKWRSHGQGSPITIKYIVPSVSGIPSYRGCVDQSALNQCIDDDLHMWASACPFGMFDFVRVSALAPSESGITFEFDDNSADFGSGQDPLRLAAGRAGETYDWSHDSAEITTSKIWLNVSSVMYEHYILTTCPKTCTIIKPQYALSICALILHELGHSFGLLDLRGRTPQDWWQSVMYGEEGAGKADPCGPYGRNYPTDLDQCYFCKLYCPSNCEDLVTPENTSLEHIFMQLLPNPAHRSCELRYSGIDPGAVIEVEDILGKTVSAFELDGAEGKVRVSFARMPKGVYVVRLHSRHAHLSRRLVVE